MLALDLAGPLKWQIESLAKLAHPSNLACGIADDKGIVRHIARHNCTCSDEGVAADLETANYRAISAQASASAYDGVTIFFLSRDLCPRVVDICENHRGSTKDTLLQNDVVVDTDVVLDLASISDDYAIAHKCPLSQRYILANGRSTTNVSEVPYAAAFADLRSVVDYCAGVDLNRHGSDRTIGCISPSLLIGLVRIEDTVSIATLLSSRPKLRLARISS